LPAPLLLPPGQGWIGDRDGENLGLGLEPRSGLGRRRQWSVSVSDSELHSGSVGQELL